MADSREYISRTEPEGSINISEDVLSIIAGEAIKDVDGVGGAGGASIGKELLGKKNFYRGVKVSVEGESVTIDTYIVVTYGRSVSEVAKQVQSSVTKAIEDMTGMKVLAVNVHVNGIAFDRDK